MVVPKVGDIITYSSYEEWDAVSDIIYPTKPSIDDFFVVTAIIDMKEGRVVHYRKIGEKLSCSCEDIRMFPAYLKVLEGATEESIKVLYGRA